MFQKKHISMQQQDRQGGFGAQTCIRNASHGGNHRKSSGTFYPHKQHAARESLIKPCSSFRQSGPICRVVLSNGVRRIQEAYPTGAGLNVTPPLQNRPFWRCHHHWARIRIQLGREGTAPSSHLQGAPLLSPNA